MYIINRNKKPLQLNVNHPFANSQCNIVNKFEHDSQCPCIVRFKWTNFKILWGQGLLYDEVQVNKFKCVLWKANGVPV